MITQRGRTVLPKENYPQLRAVRGMYRSIEARPAGSYNTAALPLLEDNYQLST